MIIERVMKMLEKYELVTGCETVEKIKMVVEAIVKDFPINNFTSDMRQFIAEAVFLANKNELDQEENEVIDWLADKAKREIERAIIDKVQNEITNEIENQILMLTLDDERGRYNINNILYDLSKKNEIKVTPNGLIRWKQRKFLGGYRYASPRMATFTHEEELEIRRLRALKCTEYVALNLKNAVIPSFESVDVDGYDIIIKL